MSSIPRVLWQTDVSGASASTSIRRWTSIPRNSPLANRGLSLSATRFRVPDSSRRARTPRLMLRRRSTSLLVTRPSAACWSASTAARSTRQKSTNAPCMTLPGNWPVFTKDTIRSGEDPSKRAASVAVNVAFKPKSSAPMCFIFRLMGAWAWPRMISATMARTGAYAAELNETFNSLYQAPKWRMNCLESAWFAACSFASTKVRNPDDRSWAIT
ncbi:Uncharacterised protein [Pseudomonas fragi]|uniref:Uncharacterized protein n=1 Tax=Pseudomonas fragi TaxID=296 RepID=A0A449IHW2_PSEFR|nr:Uncharacterised protein [Pseudomonas fragi]